MRMLHYNANEIRYNFELADLVYQSIDRSLTFSDETLITVTADHSHVFTIGTYPKRGNPIFNTVLRLDGKLEVGTDNMTYTNLGYTNGEGAVDGAHQDLRGVDTTYKDYRQQATVPQTPRRTELKMLVCESTDIINIAVIFATL